MKMLFVLAGVLSSAVTLAADLSCEGTEPSIDLQKLWVTAVAGPFEPNVVLQSFTHETEEYYLSGLTVKRGFDTVTYAFNLFTEKGADATLQVAKKEMMLRSGTVRKAISATLNRKGEEIQFSCEDLDEL